MANIRHADSDFIYDSRNISLLDVIVEKNKVIGKQHLLHRLIYVARVAPGIKDKKEIGEYFQNLFNKYVTDLDGDGVTGLLLIYPYHILHILEVSSEVLNDVIREQETSETNNNYHVLEMPAIQMNDLANATSNEPIDAMVLQCLRAITKLSKHLAKVPEINLASAIDVLVEKSPDDLYPQNDIEVLVRSNELCGAVEFQEKYYAPLNIILDEEIVWPMPHRIFPSN